MASDMKRINQDPKLNAMLGRKKVKEEVEELDELDTKTLKSYAKKASKDITKRAGSGDTDSTKFTNRASSHIKAMKKIYDKEPYDTSSSLKNVYKKWGKTEETYMDAKAATPSVMSPGEGISEKKTTLQRVMMLKKKKLKEDMFDHEKEDKSVATYGKKPKFEKADKDDSIGENKPTAAATMSGGTTLTGNKRDIVEIDPMMRNRPGQPDVTKGKDKKDDKDKDKKKDK